MQAAEAERRVLEAAKRARAEVEAQLAEKDPEAMGLDAAGRRLLAQNRVMAQELALHIEEAEALHVEVQILQVEAGQLRRDNELKTEMEAQCARRGVTQARRLTEETTKVAALEGSLARMLQDFQKDRKALTAAFAAERSEAQGDIRALRQLAKARGRALHKVRELAQAVMAQRTEVEVFLVSSLQLVRSEMGLGSKRQLSLPQTEQEGAGDLAEVVPDTKDMTWGDREKVLRMLFASLQRQRQEPVQAPAQKVSYESDDDEVDNAGPLRGIMNLAGPAQLA
ncbi:hypothetical protein CVIRNUC_005286 [Coccomyxa viridis]|uniref:Cilia- and flagella-associated protein 157 n=1 Tax=Coccomyxa viridis TaxID=1274662 RepID=A0AAV1I4P4_9CHLO|nr:hypothetical protein CVIRNUC_005286 [Coccomyxa viridis]